MSINAISPMLAQRTRQVQPKEQIKSKEVHFLQTGVYQTKDNATKMQLELSTLQIQGYVYQKENLYYVLINRLMHIIATCPKHKSEIQVHAHARFYSQHRAESLCLYRLWLHERLQ